MSKATRKLAAIVFTDIVGFTKLSSQDENKAFSLLDTQRNTLKPIVNEFGGEWLKEMGDGLAAARSAAGSQARADVQFFREDSPVTMILY